MSFFDILSTPIKNALSQVNCSFCGIARTDIGVCSPCLQAISPVKASCSLCASPLPHSPSEGDNARKAPTMCGRCLQTPPVYRKILTATHYRFPVDQAISQLKFNQQLHFARTLSKVLETKVADHYKEPGLPQALVAIPLHPKRQKERGFNQSDLITEHLSKSFSIPQVKSLIRVKDTPHQLGLSEQQRKKNLKGAFKLDTELPRHIALVDDVVTTGSTINEAAKQCLKQGTERIDVWCLSKT